MKVILPLTAALLWTAALVSAQKAPVQVGPIIKPLMDEADACMKAQRTDCADLYRRIIDTYRTLPPDDYEDYLYYKLGRAFFLYGRQDSALHYLRRASDIATAQADEAMLADILNVQGTAHYMQGKVEEAITYFIASAQSLERQGDSIHAAYTYVNIGLTLGEMESNEESLKYLLRAYRTLDAHKEERYRPVTAANVGLGYYHVGDLPNAIRWAEKALAMTDASLEQSTGPVAYYTLALAHPNEPAKALGYARQAVDIASRHNLRNSIHADALVVYAELLLRHDQAAEAMRQAEQAISIYQEEESPVGLNRAYRTAAQAAAATGQYAKAASYWENHAVANDSLLMVSNRKIVNELNLRFETERKDRELAQGQLLIARQSARIQVMTAVAIGVLALLGGLWLYYHQVQRLRLATLRQAQELEVVNAWMLGEEQERNRLSKELHDGVASLVSAALMHLRAGHSELQQAKVEGILERTHTEIRRIAHNLLPLTLDRRGLLAAVEEFCGIVNGFGALEVQFTHSLHAPLALGKPHQLVVFRIVQELVQNALKHSGASLVRISIAQQGHTLKVEVEDNGRGLPAEGADENQGMASIRERIRTLGGDVAITSGEAVGFRAELSVAGAFL